MDLKQQTKAPAETQSATGAYVGNPGIEAGVAPVERAPRPIEAGVDIGHVHLRAGDLGKIKDFYVEIGRRRVGKSVDLGGGRMIKKKKTRKTISIQVRATSRECRPKI